MDRLLDPKDLEKIVGLPSEQIAQIAGLTVEEIKKLINYGE